MAMASGILVWLDQDHSDHNKYHSSAIHPRLLSLFERVVLKTSRRYDRVLDRDSEIEELRQLCERDEWGYGKENVGRRRCRETLTEDASAYLSGRSRGSQLRAGIELCYSLMEISKDISALTENRTCWLDSSFKHVSMHISYVSYSHTSGQVKARLLIVS